MKEREILEFAQGLVFYRGNHFWQETPPFLLNFLSNCVCVIWGCCLESPTAIFLPPLPDCGIIFKFAGRQTANIVDTNAKCKIWVRNVRLENFLYLLKVWSSLLIFYNWRKYNLFREIKWYLSSNIMLMVMMFVHNMHCIYTNLTILPCLQHMKT